MLKKKKIEGLTVQSPVLHLPIAHGVFYNNLSHLKIKVYANKAPGLFVVFSNIKSRHFKVVILSVREAALIVQRSK